MKTPWRRRASPTPARDSDMPSFQSVAVIGSGAYGTALACAAVRAGRQVTLYARNAGPARADIILLAIPSQSLRDAAQGLAPHLTPSTPVVACAKGIERGTHKFMTEVIAEALPHAFPAILSGPNFADDVARGLPTAVTLAAKDEGLASDLVQALGSATFRPYHSTDVRGVEIGGAAKNVLAIAAGIVEGRKLGASAPAALTTRCFSELIRLGHACGARSETMVGLSGLGDLILTCSTPQSRNFSFGVALGRGGKPDDIQSTTGLAAGAFTAAV